ncbi:hypothetical protein ABEB36_000398 [Hypothenemus hampei]|uniref:Uncharacterized protein n=1 Tax=Hypothenemus hampei TaxID=57062 RepID=A0ABD1FDQ2_HYPHA
MAFPEVSYHSVLQQLRTDDPNSDAKYIEAGKTTDQLLRHAVAHEYIIVGRTAEEIAEHRGSSSFDFESLKRDFQKICEGYKTEVIPNQRQVKKTTGDKVWKFLFIYKKSDQEVLIQTAFVSTFNEDANVYTPEATNTKIVLTVRHASLLAILTLERITMVAISMTPPRPLLTLLAGAVFSKGNINTLANLLQATPIAVLCTINTSYQSGGQYLSNSRLYMALVAAVVATKNVKVKAKV